VSAEEARTNTGLESFADLQPRPDQVCRAGVDAYRAGSVALAVQHADRSRIEIDIVGDDTALLQSDGILVDVSYATVTGNNARNGLTIPIHVTASATHNVVVGNTGAVTDDTSGTGSNEIAHNMAI
jgi:hypothetical protein